MILPSLLKVLTVFFLLEYFIWFLHFLEICVKRHSPQNSIDHLKIGVSDFYHSND